MSKQRRVNINKALMEQEYVDLEEKNQCLVTALYQVGRTQPFMGAVLQSLNIMYSHMLPTAGVSFNAEAKRWDLYINPKFFCHKLNNVLNDKKESIGDLARKAVLLHELAHITNKHPMRLPFLKISPQKRTIMNVAADMAINQFIPNLPKGCPECPPKASAQENIQCNNPNCCGMTIDVADWFDEDKSGKKTPWETNKTTEYYYEKIIKKMEENEDNNCDSCGGDGEEKDSNGEKTGKTCKKCKGSGKASGLPDTLDDHGWDASGDENDMLEATEDLLKRAMVKKSMSYDELPQSIKDLLEHIQARKAELNYKAEILAAIKKSASGHERKHSWSRKSRRFGNKAPGTKIGDLPKLNFYIDTSGSISIEEANEFLSIVDNFLRAGSRKCRLNLFHTDNYYSEEYKLGQRIKREQFQSGGTCLEKAFRDIAKRKPDLAVIVTDGFFDDVNVDGWLPNGVSFPQCLFIISRQGSETHPLTRFGRTIKIPDSAQIKNT